MFDTTSRRTSPSLLMTAPAGDETPAVHSADVADPAEAHRRARRKRLAKNKKPLTAAFGPKDHIRADERLATDTASALQKPEAADRTPEPHLETPGPALRQEPPRVTTSSSLNEPWDQPSLIDAATVVHTVWHWRWIIIALTFLGGLLGIVIALSTPKQYTAYASVLIDPREIRLVERDLTPEFLANEAALAIIDSRLVLAQSTPVLERVVERTNLSQDSEFNGEGGSAFSVMGLIRGLVSGAGEPSDRTESAIDNLRSAVSADRSARTFVVNIGVESRSPEKAALLANEVARAFIEQQSGLRAESARDASAALGGRLATLQSDVEQAEQRVEDFRLANNLVNAQGRLISDDELVAVNASLTAAKAATREAQSRADTARDAGVDTVVSGALPTALVTPALTTFRAQLASLKQQLAPLETQLGPRHPRLENLRAAVSAAEADIDTELDRIVAGTQADLRSAIQTEQQTAQQLAQLKAQLSNNSDALVELRELEREAATARGIYESALLRAREAGEMEAVNTGNARIVTEAEPPTGASSTSRQLVVIASAMAGFALGMGLAILSGVIKSIQQATSAPTRAGQGPTGPAVTSQTHAGPDGHPGGRTRNASADDATPSSAKETVMNPYYPYYANPAMAGYPAQPVQAQPQMQPAYAPVQQAAPQPAVPQPAPHGLAPMPQGYPMQPMAAPAPAMPMMQPPQMMPHMPAPAYPQAMQPQVQPLIVPIIQQPIPAAAPSQPAANQPESHPAPALREVPKAQSPDHADEMNELRQSVRDIRDMVDRLTARRYG